MCVCDMHFSCVCVYVCVCVCMCVYVCVCVCVCVCVMLSVSVPGGVLCVRETEHLSICVYGVATISRLLKIRGLFCRLSSLL